MSTFVCSHPLSRVYDVFTFTTNAEHFSSVAGQMVAETTALSSPPFDAKPPRREKGNMPRPRPSIYGLCTDELLYSLAVVPHPHYGKSIERRRDVEN